MGVDLAQRAQQGITNFCSAARSGPAPNAHFQFFWRQTRAAKLNRRTDCKDVGGARNMISNVGGRSLPFFPLGAYGVKPGGG